MKLLRLEAASWLAAAPGSARRQQQHDDYLKQLQEVYGDALAPEGRFRVAAGVLGPRVSAGQRPVIK